MPNPNEPELAGGRYWRRLDTAGAEHVVLDDRAGLVARGTMLAADPTPFTCAYTLRTDRGWESVRLEVSAVGAGWSRGVALYRGEDGWRVTATERGDLDAVLRREGGPATPAPGGSPSGGTGPAPGPLPGIEDPEQIAGALDVDLGECALTNTLPIRRLGLLAAAPGTSVTILAAWVLVPSLSVVPARQTYTVLGPGRIRYSSGTYRADLDIDPDGYVVHYPGMAGQPDGIGPVA